MLRLDCGPAGLEKLSLDTPMRSFSRSVARGKCNTLFILIAWWLSQTSGLHAHSVISFRELLREPTVFVPGCFVESVDAADVFVGVLTCFAVKEMQQFSARLSKQHGGLFPFPLL